MVTFARTKQQRHLFPDPTRIAHRFGQLGKEMLGHRMRWRGRRLLGKRVEMKFSNSCGIDSLIPQLECAHASEKRHLLSIAGDCGHRRVSVAMFRKAQVAARKSDARGQPLEIPLPGCTQRLVEVVDVEYQVALRRSEAAEVHQMRITASLHRDAAYQRPRQVVGHDRSSATKK